MMDDLRNTVYIGPFHGPEDSTVDILEGLISPFPAQALVAPPPSRPPKTRPGESTPLTGSLATPPSQAVPRVAPTRHPEISNDRPQDAPQKTSRNETRKILARYLVQHPLRGWALDAAKTAAQEPRLQAAILGATNQPQETGSADAASGRLTTQPSDNPAVNQALATEAMEKYEGVLREIVARIPGTRLTAIREAKNPSRLAEKIEQAGQPAQTVSDYGAAQIAVDSDQAKDAVIRAMKGRFPILRERDFFSEGDPDFGYRAYTMQVQMPSGISEELQILPREVQRANRKEHSEYKTARNRRLAGKNVKPLEAAAKKLNNRAMKAFRLRNLAKGSQVRLQDGSKGVVAYLDPNMKIARVRTEDGRNATVRLANIS